MGQTIPGLLREIALIAAKRGDTGPLATYLRHGGEFTPAIREVVVEALAPRRKPPSPTMMRMMARDYVAHYQEALARIDEDDEWQRLEVELRNVGYRGIPETKGERTDAARRLAAHTLGISLPQLRGRLRPTARSERPRAKKVGT